MNDKVSQKSKAERKRYLAFSLGSEEYAIPLLTVKEVAAMPETTRVPYTPPYFLGIMNLRGQIISVFDLRLKFQIKPEKTAETAVIICDFGPLCFGVVVDSVNSVLSLREEEISEKPEIDGRQGNEYILGITKQGEKLILLLDLTKALSVKDHSSIKQSA